MLSPSPLVPIAIRLIRCDHGSVVLDAHGTIRGGRCPACGTTSIRVHDRCRRHPSDLPWHTCSVHLTLTVRRFCCDAQACSRRTFAEGFGSALLPRARRTRDADSLHLDLTEPAGGEPKARLARVIAVGRDYSTRTIGEHPRTAKLILVEVGHRPLGTDLLTWRPTWTIHKLRAPVLKHEG